MSILTVLLAASLQFVPPVNEPITLAGNFGEPRPHHFHGGIDVRTGMAVGKPIFAVADGYVSRITIGLFGFGNAVYVAHPDGHTSVYCHLKDFTPQERVRISLYRKKNNQPDRIDEWHNPAPDVADIYLKPHEIPVSRGQLVAISGNTGSSVAPHLHLEVHDTKTWAMRDPLSFVGQYLTDTTPPQAHAFMAYPQEGRGVFNGSNRQQYFGFPSNHLEREFTAWGRVGFGLWANDYMEGTYHHYGIRHTRLTIDGEVVFESDVDSIPARMNRQVNSWGDYLHWLHQNVWYMKSFAEPGCQLPMLKYNGLRGYFDFNEERAYDVAYVLTDAFGNQSTYTFRVLGRRQAIPAAIVKDAHWTLHWNRVNHVQLPGVQLTVRKGMLPDDVELHPRISRQGRFSDVYTFASQSLPLFGDAELRIRLNQEVANPEQYCIAAANREFPTTCKDGWLIASIRDLGLTYEIKRKDFPATLQ